MEKGDTRINVRNESLSHVALNELNRPVLPATSGSLKIALLIAGLAAILALVLGLSIGLTHKGKDKKFTRVNIIKSNNSTNSTNSTTPTNPTNSTNTTNTTSNDPWDESYKKADQFISKLNSTERVNLLFGTENMIMETLLWEDSMRGHKCVGQIDAFSNSDVNFKGMCLQDGPAGVRFAEGTGISWQASINAGMTFDKKLMYDVGKAQGEENKEKGINVDLAPCANMLRNPKGGRIWEAYGDDPYYTGVCAAETTKGIQDAGVIACLKHFVANDQETYRKSSSSNIEKRALMDVYVEPFYRSIKEANLGSIMAAYNALNNTYCYENKYLLTDILRDILGFKGFVMSDWWEITNDDPIVINSGVDMNMPGGKEYGPFEEERKYTSFGRNNSYWSNLEQQVKEGNVTQERIDEAAKRIIATMYQMNQMEDFPEVNILKKTNTEERKTLQRKVATESQVLLKNDGILPLNISNLKTIGVVGNDAFERDCLPSKLPQCLNTTNEVINGHIPLGFGSGVTNFEYLITPLAGIKNYAEKHNVSVISSGKMNYKKGIGDKKDVSVTATEDIEGGIEVANNSDVVIVFVKASSGEEFVVLEEAIGDRRDLDVWYGGNELINNITEVNDNVIVVINAPATVNLPWKDKVKAIIFSGFPGAESGNAIADILFGEVNPSGHLPFVWAKDEEYGAQIPHLENLTIIDGTNKTYKDLYRYDGIDCHLKPDHEYPSGKEQINYTDGLYIGQRWFNKNKKQPEFPFGFGLSYTTFDYSDLTLNMNENGLEATFNIKNTGNCTGKAVPMMFLTFPSSIGEYPEGIFKGFEKVEIPAGETKSVSILADDHALSYFNVDQNNYVRVKDGKIKVYINDNANLTSPKLQSEIDANY